ncbi:DUF6508 domain-containing protein [Sphingobacterium siyangense]|uniref:DUF6508 domain-containing protein n=1 Tax=Sphingobacterium siyangense TaxID=459529 RepID=UPI003DA33B5B
MKNLFNLFKFSKVKDSKSTQPNTDKELNDSKDFALSIWKDISEVYPYLVKLSENCDPSKEDGDIEYLCSKIYDIVHFSPILQKNLNWMNWDEGEKMVNDENFDFNSIDTLTKCKLMSAICRAERFSDGAIRHYVLNGTMLRIINSIKQEARG